MAVGKLDTEADLQRFIEELLVQRLTNIEARLTAIETRLKKAGIP